MSEHNAYAATNSTYVKINGNKVPKVKEPFYKSKDRIIYADCPVCKWQVQRIWNLNYCGNCGAQITWLDIDTADLPTR